MKPILKSLFGRVYGLADDDTLVITKGLRIGDYPKQLLQPSPLHVVLFDDFEGITLATRWGVNKGSDGGAANFAINAALNGTVRATTGAGAGASMAVNGVQINGALNYQANSGSLQFGTRVKLGSIANAAIFVGFTNQIAALQMPINGAGGGDNFTNNANDAVGFLFDTTMTTPKWWGVGAKAGVSAAGQNSGSAPVAGTYDDMFVSVDTQGNAKFFLNGAAVGVITANAITNNVPLTPVIAAFRRTNASTTIDADYLYTANARV